MKILKIENHGNQDTCSTPQKSNVEIPKLTQFSPGAG